MFERLKSWFVPEVPELRGMQVHTATDYGRDILINSPDGWEHDRQYMWWVDGPGGGSQTGFGNPPPDARFTGAEALPAVLRCTAIIADTIAGLPWRVYRGFDQQPTPRFIADPQLLRMDRRIFDGPIVADAMSSVEFWTQWFTSALWFGDGIAYAHDLDAFGQLAPPLSLLDPSTITIRPSEKFAVRDPETGKLIALSSYWQGETELDSRLVLRLRGEPPYENGKMGTGVFDRFAGDVQLAAAMRQYASSIFTNGVPAGYLKVNSPKITDEQAIGLQTTWMQRHGGPRKKIAVLDNATDFVPITMSPIQAGLSEAKTWSLRDIALAFGVPAYMLGVPGDSSTYANVESRMTELRTFTLLPWIRRAEAALDALFPQGTEVKIITDGTLRADSSTRFAAYESALRAGWMTVDEVRALEDRPPLPEQVSTSPEDTLPDVTGDDLAASQPDQVQEVG